MFLHCSRPILITGAPRSGTTWVGKMLSTAPSVGLIMEPFRLTGSVDYRPGICKASFDNWLPYIGVQNENQYIDAIRNTINFVTVQLNV